MIHYTDQMGFQGTLPAPPQRIISLVPSQTELLFDLGLAERIVGITKFCIHPKERVDAVAKIGGTKQFKMEQIAALQPDLIIGNKEENYQEGIEALRQQYPVWMSDIQDLPQALAMIEAIGALTDTLAQAQKIANHIQKSFGMLEAYTANQAPAKPLRVAYLIWRKPYMAAGGATFIHHLLERCAYENVFAAQERYPAITEAMLQEAAPDEIFLSSEPYPFGQKHIAELQAYCPQARIRLVDGELFSWYGSRLQKSVPYFLDLLKESREVD